MIFRVFSSLPIGKFANGEDPLLPVAEVGP